MTITDIAFEPLRGLSSKHLQMIFSSFPPLKKSFPSIRELIPVEEGVLCCEVSTPSSWQENEQTIVLVHGMGGSHLSSYMIRIAKKNYERGKKVVRINLRGCGSGSGLSKLPYSAGVSSDVEKVLAALKQKTPKSDMILIGFSLGGNVVLKLAGEMKEQAKTLVKKIIAVCPPIDLADTVKKLHEKSNRMYHFYYLRQIYRQAKMWARGKKYASLYEFDDKITAPLWGYKDAEEYYKNCSSSKFIPHIEQSTYMLFAKDDPFISFDRLSQISLPSCVKVFVSEKGSHMGFIGKDVKGKSIYWMDEMLLDWIEKDFIAQS